ncbi:hypothetical protein [Halegenticoccus tardaugens]|uniref:hypothetical protein n=1 Tax=Halegenticoccus tardaugens TaxID=2071624 RepID=UPI001E3B2739|nr:hypothetical protein [Halegenticoccus tardaugens]
MSDDPDRDDEFGDGAQPGGADATDDAGSPDVEAEAAGGGEHDSPIDGQVILLTAAKASVAPQALPGLLDRTQAYLAPLLDDYCRRYEMVNETDDYCAFLVEPGHWKSVGDELGFERRESDAVERTHGAQLLRIGKYENRREEFETALEIREAVVIGTG